MLWMLRLRIVQPSQLVVVMYMAAQIWMHVTIMQMPQQMMVAVIILMNVLIVMVAVHVKLTVLVNAADLQQWMNVVIVSPCNDDIS